MEHKFLEFGGKLFNLADKEKALSLYLNTMLSRTAHLFKWENLPDTIPQYELEKQLQINGHCGFFYDKDNLYSLTGGKEGFNKSAYNIATEYRITNTALDVNKVFTIDKDIIVCKNDSTEIGLYYLFKRYCTQLVENDLTLLIADINSRIPYIIVTDDDDGKTSAEKMMKNIIQGRTEILVSDELLNKVNTLPYGANVTHSLSDLIEYQQYIKASMFNDIGLDANYNMKREAINSVEAQMNSDGLLPFVDDMLKCRKEFAEKINLVFGTNISVDFDGVWKTNEIKQELSLDETTDESEVTEDDNETTVQEENTDG